MKKIYIIPGLGEDCNLTRYRSLIKVFQAKGCKVIPVNPNWSRPISEQVFPVEKNAIVFGFSLGAILAYLVVKKYPCKLLILGSTTPIHKFSFKFIEKIFSTGMDKDVATAIAKDLKKIKVSLSALKVPFTTLAGEREKMKADFLVPKTSHYLSKKYIEYVGNLVK